MKEFKIGKRKVGLGHPCFIIAEISCNHLQKKEYALKLIAEAKAAGADAVKFQTYTPDTMTIDSKGEPFLIKGTIWEGKTLYDLYKEAYTPWNWFEELRDCAREEGIEFFSTPFDETAADLLEKLGAQIYKIASFEINHLPLLAHVAKKGKPIIFSTGVATLSDIELAVDTIRENKNDQIMIMKCTSSYPAPVSSANLNTIPNLAETFGVLVGLSDHTMSNNVAIAAVAKGAVAIEKHFILKRSMGGPDAKFSIEPNELKQLVNSVHESQEALGKVTYSSSKEVEEHKFFMRSLFVVKDMKKGEKFSLENVRVIRPGSGMHPRHLPKILGSKARSEIKRGTPLDWNLVE
ncbi:pseudaminic acid synthase [Candidatus Micrarchaeota archaeon]|nr:pseudaminic acid synthase [Candidatus Micrarchaeota archaeon]